MSPDVSERRFEKAIECALLAGGPDACREDVVLETEGPSWEGAPGGYCKRPPEAFDRTLCLLP
jgi:hypothetical protein